MTLVSSTVATRSERWASARVAVLCGVIGLSLVLPAAWASQAIRSVLSSKPLGLRSSETRLFIGGLKQAELWFPVIRRRGNGPVPQTEVDILRLDLSTGVESETGITLDRAHLPVWIGDQLYLYSPTDIKRVDGTNLQSLGPSHEYSTIGPPFEYEGQLTVVAQADGGVFRLLHWHESEWQPSRKILLPDGDRIWLDDPQQNRKTLLPVTCAQPKRTAAPVDFHLTVVPEPPDIHLLVTARQPNFAAYRKGFELVEDASDEASATAPENSVPEVSGWEQVDSTVEDDLWVQMVCDHNGLLFQAVRHEIPRIVWRNPDGRCEQLSGQHESAAKRPELDDEFIASDPSEANAFVIRSNEWGSASIAKVDGNVVRPPHALVFGSEKQYLAHWQTLTSQVGAAWLLHFVILFCGACWLARRGPSSRLADADTVPASIWRRTAAAAVDQLIWLGIVALIGWSCLSGLLNRIRWPSGTRLAETLFRLETCVLGAMEGTGQATADPDSSMVQPIQPFLDSLMIDRELFWLLILLIFIPYAAKVAIEGRYGLTIGKWLLGVRTAKVNSRRCGAVRILVRDVANCCEFLLLTPLLTVISVVGSAQHQRFGDRVAGTVVMVPQHGK